VIGEETVTTEATAAGGRRIASDFAFVDRGTRVALSATLEFDKDGEVVHFASKGKTYRLFSTDVGVTRTGTRVEIRDADGTNETLTLAAGAAFFPIDNYAPIAAQEELLRYWVRKGRPAEIIAPPAGIVRIRRVGLTVSEPAPGRPLEGDTTFERVAIDGVVWGTETAIVGQQSGQILGLTTWAGNLPFEAVAAGREAFIPRLIADAARDRVADLAAASRQLAPIASGSFALTHARIVQGTDAPPIEDGTIVVRDGRIAAVGTAASVQVPPGVPATNLTGKTIIPGLWDMHAHASQTDWAFPYLAGGVTTIRDMGGENEFLVPFRNAIETGRVLAPRMLLAGISDAPGPAAFGHEWVSTPDEGRAYVRRLKADRFEEVKIYTGVTADVVRAMSDEAHKLGMMVTGHTPRGAREAVENGYDQIAHGNLPGPAGSEATNDLIAFYKAHGTALDPTQSWNELGGHSSQTPIESFIPGVSRLPRTLKRQFAGMSASNNAPAQVESRLLQSLRMLNVAREAGIPVVTGTDKGIPGFSLQRDIELYVKGGMTPLQAIQAATIVPARVMKLDKDSGTIETGKRADLVILDGNPLDDIANIRAASRVVVNGQLYLSNTLWTAAGFAVK
jgi:imidazolonepropionase-like amidohydrolase